MAELTGIMEKKDKKDRMTNEDSREQLREELCSIVYSIAKAPVNARSRVTGILSPRIKDNLPAIGLVPVRSLPRLTSDLDICSVIRSVQTASISAVVTETVNYLPPSPPSSGQERAEVISPSLFDKETMTADSQPSKKKFSENNNLRVHTGREHDGRYVDDISKMKELPNVPKRSNTDIILVLLDKGLINRVAGQEEDIVGSGRVPPHLWPPPWPRMFKAVRSTDKSLTSSNNSLTTWT
jgi:hypothetical protein